MSLVEAFWRDESTPAIRRLLLDEAVGRSSGAAEFHFNLFDVVLDFESGTAAVADALTRDRPAEEIDLKSFLERASAFNDAQAMRDGRTSLQRTRPQFEIASDGTTDRLPDADPDVPTEDEVIAARTAWFGFYTNQRNVFAPPEDGPYTCPCCGHRTLGERGAYEICRQCGWEDDGQDDHDSDVVRGGPNGRLSLDAARARYQSDGGRPGLHEPPSDPV